MKDFGNYVEGSSKPTESLSSTASSQRLRIDRRSIRARELSAQIMHIVEKYITNVEDNYRAAAACDLQNIFYDTGAELFTDGKRQMVGLPARDDLGWTRDEILAYEQRFCELMQRPLIVFPEGSQ